MAFSAPGPRYTQLLIEQWDVISGCLCPEQPVPNGNDRFAADCPAGKYQDAERQTSCTGLSVVFSAPAARLYKHMHVRVCNSSQRTRTLPNDMTVQAWSRVCLDWPQTALPECINMHDDIQVARASRGPSPSQRCSCCTGGAVSLPNPLSLTFCLRVPCADCPVGKYQNEQRQTSCLGLRQPSHLPGRPRSSRCCALLFE